jgi:hypothetical protein
MPRNVATHKAPDVKTASMPDTSLTRMEKLLGVANTDWKQIVNSRTDWDGVEGSTSAISAI